MKKIILTTLLAFTSVAFAEQNYFVGGMVSYTAGEATTNYKDSNVERTQGYGVKVGLEGNIYRSYLESSKIQWNNSEAQIKLLNGELTFPLGNPFGTKKDMKLYMGLHYGKIDFKTALTGNDKANGEIYGMQMGILSPCLLNDKATVEVGFKDSKTNITTQTSTYTHDLSSLNSLYLGFNYSF